MSEQENKVVFGLKNVHVWPIVKETDTETTYGTAIKLPGAVQITLKAEGDDNPFHADNMVYWNQFSNNGYKGDLEIANLTEAFETSILKNEKDANGAIVEKSNAQPSDFAMAFEFNGDAFETRHLFYKCTCSRPDVAGKTTTEKKDPLPVKVSISASPNAEGVIKTKLKKGANGYDTFFETPYKLKTD